MNLYEKLNSDAGLASFVTALAVLLFSGGAYSSEESATRNLTDAIKEHSTVEQHPASLYAEAVGEYFARKAMLAYAAGDTRHVDVRQREDGHQFVSIKPSTLPSPSATVAGTELATMCALAGSKRAPVSSDVAELATAFEEYTEASSREIEQFYKSYVEKQDEATQTEIYAIMDELPRYRSVRKLDTIAAASRAPEGFVVAVRSYCAR
ncbi:MAG: hypothetical protein AAGI44_07340 [Pseudomonadota bacterium]